jgi:mRNA-degrading endonuclease RelE of RelBE toxin-antitoxin system
MAKVFSVELSPSSKLDFDGLRKYEQQRVIEAIEGKLQMDPNVTTRAKKCLGSEETANFVFTPPLWQLRVGDYRVFYDVDDNEKGIYPRGAQKAGA